MTRTTTRKWKQHFNELLNEECKQFEKDKEIAINEYEKEIQ